MAEYLRIEHKKHDWHVWKKVDEHLLDPKNAGELPRNLVAAALLGSSSRGEGLAAMAKAYRVDLKAIERSVGKDLRAAFNKRKAKALEKAKKAKKTAKKAAK
jgi:hypothetical protein